MNTNMQGHDHGGKSHLFGMLAIGALVLVGLLAAGRSVGEALPLAALLACPLMMIGMMYMMRGSGGNNHQHDDTSGDRTRRATDEQLDPAFPQSAVSVKTRPLPLSRQK